MTEENKPFWRSAFSESGYPSMSRVMTGFAVLGAIAWTTIIVLRKTELPDFGGMTLFISALYGINKAAQTVTAVSDAKGSTNVAANEAKTQ
jgi:hypothetical protein